MKKGLFLLITGLLLQIGNTLAADYYLIGGFNKWTSKQADCKFTEGVNGEYTLDYVGTLSSGFKINDGTWDNPEAIWGGSTTLIVGKEYSLTTGNESGDIPLAENIDNPHLVFNPEANTLLITGEQVPIEYAYAIHGNFVPSWETKEMTEKNGIWTLAVQVDDALDFGIRQVDLSSQSQKGWISSAGNGTVILNNPMPCVENGTTWTMTDTGKFNFKFDPQAMTLTVEKVGAKKLYGFGMEPVGKGWNPTLGNELTSVAPGIFTWEGEVKSTCFFYFVEELSQTEDWESFYRGTRYFPITDYCSIDEEGVYNMCAKSGNTTNAWALSPGIYKFEINTNTNVLKVIKSRSVGVNDLYLIGNVTGWGKDSAYKMTTTDGVTYTLTTDLEAGDPFKFSDGDWSSINLGLPTTHYTLTDGTYQLISGNYSQNLGLAKGGKVTFTLVQSNNFASAALTISHQSDTPTPPDPTLTSGVYFGITAFNYLPEIMPMDLLTLQNKNDYKNFVNSRTTDDYTYLYYSAEQALKTLKNRSYPQDLSSVTLITFTDGNDDGSLEVAPDKSWDDIAYQNYIDNLIATAKIQGIKVDAYSIGLKGEDIGEYNYAMFKSNLQALATEPKDKHATEVENMMEVENTLKEILDGLETSWLNKKVRCNINMRATGDKIRFTLDKTREEMNNNPDNSDIWIEGVFSRDDNSMNNVVYHGLTSTSGSKVVSKKVEINGRTKYQFTFENLKDKDENVLKTGVINFWHSTSSNPVWQPHTEFGQGTDAEVETARSSAAIMFVMDCSSSLGDDFVELKRVANDLIDRLAPEEVPTSVKEIEAGTDDAKEYYSLQGIRVANPSSGIYIVKKGNKVTKHYIAK